MDCAACECLVVPGMDRSFSTVSSLQSYCGVPCSGTWEPLVVTLGLTQLWFTIPSICSDRFLSWQIGFFVRGLQVTSYR